MVELRLRVVAIGNFVCPGLQTDPLHGSRSRRLSATVWSYQPRGQFMRYRNRVLGLLSLLLVITYLGEVSEFGQQSTVSRSKRRKQTTYRSAPLHCFSTNPQSSKLLILFTRRPTNVLYCPNSEGTPSRVGIRYSWPYGLQYAN
jgi:hypothetical protein